MVQTAGYPIRVHVHRGPIGADPGWSTVRTAKWGPSHRLSVSSSVGRPQTGASIGVDRWWRPSVCQTPRSAPQTRRGNDVRPIGAVGERVGLSWVQGRSEPRFWLGDRRSSSRGRPTVDADFEASSDPCGPTRSPSGNTTNLLTGVGDIALARADGCEIVTHGSDGLHADI